MQAQLMLEPPPAKIRFPQIVQALQTLMRQARTENDLDFRHVREVLAHHYDLPPDALLERGLARAYRQLIEGL